MKVIVVGGGAAGMMAAYSAGTCGNDVTLIEQNEKLGKKIYITGKGRCNVTNAADHDGLFRNINSNPKFLYSAFNIFDNASLMELIERNGCPLKTERGNRVFPVSDKSSDIIKAMTNAVKSVGVNVVLNTKVTEVLSEDGKVTGVRCGNRIFRADKVIICTGGLSYPTTGSTGDGYGFAKSFGHRLIDTSPVLVPLYTNETFVKDLQGLSLKNTELRLVSGKKTVYRETGELLFTHFGISGPLVLTASAHYDREVRKGNEPEIFLDFKPGLDPDALDKRILRDFEKEKNRQFKNSLSELLPRTLIPVIVELSGIDGEKQVNSITKAERENLCFLLKNFKLTVAHAGGYNEAVVTRGGVDVKEIDPSSMESKLVKGLYFAGEVLDLDAMTGGYNLQIAWSTGFLSGLD